MTFQHKKSGSKGLFFVEVDEEIEAEMFYSQPAENLLLIEHTEVSEALRGQNVGYELVHAAVDYARNHGLKIIPACTFTKAVFDKKPDFRDVLEPAGD
jgi:predicted GNAT family acetyltransferase